MKKYNTKFIYNLIFIILLVNACCSTKNIQKEYSAPSSEVNCYMPVEPVRFSGSIKIDVKVPVGETGASLYSCDIAPIPMHSCATEKFLISSGINVVEIGEDYEVWLSHYAKNEIKGIANIYLELQVKDGNDREIGFKKLNFEYVFSEECINQYENKYRDASGRLTFIKDDNRRNYLEALIIGSKVTSEVYNIIINRD